MEVGMLDAAGQALLTILDPYRMMMLSAGVLMGLALGIIPGIGGLTGMAMLLPFTFTMDPYTAFALLLGLLSVIGTGDTIPAILFGVPGGSSAQATVLDGNPMAKKGEAGRALSAAYTASLIGGLFGALVLGLSISFIRPVILYIGSPELVAISIFGISMVAVLSGSAPLRGLAAAGLGILLSMIGSNNSSGTPRWTLDTIYLWEGLSLVPVVLGLFAVPELADLAIKRMAIAKDGSKFDAKGGMLQGMRDGLTHWWLVLRCSTIGAIVGALPGLGSGVVDWLAYGHAARTEKDAKKTFGKGDVRGVIAPESANNSITAGALIPTIAFGVPGSLSMAVLLGAFLIHGLVPGPEMLTSKLDVTYSMVWSVAIANILGAGICFLFSGQLAKLALLRFTLIVPFVLCITLLGAYQASVSWGDFYTLVIFSVIGWTMKQLRWARPPLILGLVLGALIERYLVISISRFGYEWLLKPVVAIFLLMSLIAILRPALENIRTQGGIKHAVASIGRPSFHPSDLFYVFIIGVLGYMLYEAHGWRYEVWIGPAMVGYFAIGAATISLIYQVLRREGRTAAAAATASEAGHDDNSIHMDLALDTRDMTTRQVLTRAGIFLAWMLGFLVSLRFIGMIPTMWLFVAAYMRIEGRERWKLTLICATVFMLFVWAVFHELLHVVWPQTLLGEMFPALKAIPSM